ncbi:glutamate--tRNA ligase [Candidatus Pacearchaeota archaeon]|nr:glutamate--tRNA ligase [Candidatus Pacearchaeota archaeon]
MALKNFEKLALAYALKNALSHDGKCQQSSVLSALFNEGLKKNEVGKHAKTISEIVRDVNSLNIEEQEKEFENLKSLISEREGREGLSELPNVPKTGVIMRFAPSASGPLHVGHAMTASLSFLYVRKYGGKFYIRIEDTNPENIYPPAYKMIENEAGWLFSNEPEVLIQSYRMEIYYDYIKKLLKKNAVYVCTCSSEFFEKYAEQMKNCPCRNLKSDDNLERWNKMLSKNGFKPGEAVLRFKSPKGMKEKNPAFRDFPLARINLTPHILQKDKYRVWPLMNLAVAVDDVELGITHAIRGKDHIDNARKQEMIHKSLEKKSPWTGFLGRFNFKDMDLSTTKMRIAIEDGKYSGWDDSRLPTIAALKKKGYNPQAFWKFAEQIGLSEKDKTMDKKDFFLLLDNFNKI